MLSALFTFYNKKIIDDFMYAWRNEERAKYVICRHDKGGR